MNNLLVWPLSNNVNATNLNKIIFLSTQVTLSNITCCDTIDLYFQVEQMEYPLALGLTGCQLNSFKGKLLSIVNQTKTEVILGKNLLVSCSKLGHVLIKLYYQEEILAYFIVAMETVQAWATQLDLLEVVMQENENEKNSRGTGCC